MDLATTRVLGELNAAHGTGYRLVRRLAGGLQSGAYEVAGPDGHAVLKWTDEPGWGNRVQRAAGLVREARAAGYPTPRWIACGTTSSGLPYHLQEYVDGRPLSSAAGLTMATAENLAQGIGKAAGLVTDEQYNWSSYVHGVVFDGLGGIWDTAAALDDRSTEILARFEAACAPYQDEDLPVNDLVHGDLNVSNIVETADGVTIVDVEAISGGTRAYDLIALAASAARDGAAPGVDEFLVEAALSAAGFGPTVVCAAAGFADLALFADSIEDAALPNIQRGAARILTLLDHPL
ncbi:phosphotransferase [Kribbella deserti]|uniref:Phosphotransferase n=1 Tax=Kribbella deserti TaxID=1926257 RepID=A0ABV6QQ98_9ACTN